MMSISKYVMDSLYNKLKGITITVHLSYLDKLHASKSLINHIKLLMSNCKVGSDLYHMYKSCMFLHTCVYTYAYVCIVTKIATYVFNTKHYKMTFIVTRK